MMASSAPAAVLLGDVIAVDFASDGGFADNFNVLHSTKLTTSEVIRYNANGEHLASSAISGVSLALSAPNGGSLGFNNEPQSDALPGTSFSDPYYVLEANDLVFNSTGDPANAIMLTVSGLDDALTYNVRIYSLIGNNSNRVSTFSINGENVITNTHGDRWGSGAVANWSLPSNMVFSGQSTNGSGVITISVTSSTAAFMNAIVLEAVPEPSRMLLLALGAMTFAWRRRR